MAENGRFGSFFLFVIGVAVIGGAGMGAWRMSHEKDSALAASRDALAAGVARVQGQLLVMGAYGHSRLRDYLFGGVTRYFLAKGAGPALFLGH